MIHLRHAAAAIEAGHASTILITHGESGRSRVGVGRPGPNAGSLSGQFEAPYGAGGPPYTFTLPFLRYMHHYGVTHEQLAMVAVVQREWAAMNPRATFKTPITVDDVLNSRMIAYPFHLLECCLVTDGGGALIVTSADRARDFPTPPVYLLGSGEALEVGMVSQLPDYLASQGVRNSAAKAFAEARISHSDVDHLMIYDAFAHNPLYGLEGLGFCEPGEAAAFIADGNTRPGGSMPLNTNGGGLSYMHSGMYGMYCMMESIRQVRGVAPAQIPNVNISVAQGYGGFFNAFATLIFAREIPS